MRPEDERAIEALAPGQVWTRVLVDNHQVEATDETSCSLRLYVERMMGHDAELRYELQKDTQWDNGWLCHEIGGKEEVGTHESAAEVVALYPFWAEVATRYLKKRFQDNRDYAREEAPAYLPLTGPRLCTECAYKAGGEYILGTGGNRPNRCPVCGALRLVAALSSFRDLPEELAARAEEASRTADQKKGPRKVARKVGDPAVAAILALNKGEVYLEPGRGICVSPDGDHWPESGYCWHEWRVSVLNGGDDYEFSVETRSDTNPDRWTKDEFGVGHHSSDHSEGFTWYAGAKSVERTLRTMRALRDQEEGDYDDPEWRRAEGITEEHLRTGTLSERTLAELADESKVAA